MSDDTVKVPSSIKKKRFLKVAYNSPANGQNRKVAAIKFSGMYLEDLGFVYGEYFSLVINSDLSITLKPVTKGELSDDEKRDVD